MILSKHLTDMRNCVGHFLEASKGCFKLTAYTYLKDNKTTHTLVSFIIHFINLCLIKNLKL